MSRRAVTLTERRTRPVRLHRAEADFLLAHARDIIEVVPAFEPNTYRLTPRGYVGFVDGPTVRYEIGPKFPWPNIGMLLDMPNVALGVEALDAEGGLLAVLATEFAERLEAVTRAGLVAGYGEASTVSPFLHGKLRTTDQMRDAAATAFPDRFHITEPVFDLHTPWNRIPKATATALLRHALPAALRLRLEAALLPFAVLPDESATDADFDASFAEPRVAVYGTLLESCRLILDGLTCADPLGTGVGAFLVDLGKVFERYLTASIRKAFEARDGWNVEAQPRYAIGPVELQPDLVLRYEGAPRIVLDAKWKTAAIDSGDLHQILAYATVTGAPRVALVYPGLRDECANFTTPDGNVRVTVYRLRVVGSADDVTASAAKLARSVRKN